VTPLFYCLRERRSAQIFRKLLRRAADHACVSHLAALLYETTTASSGEVRRSADVRPRVDEYEELLTRQPHLGERLTGVGVLPADE